MKILFTQTFLSVIILLSISAFQQRNLIAQEYVNPVSNITNIGDPFVLNHNGTYYMYCTSNSNEGFYYWTSKDLVNWEKQGLAFQAPHLVSSGRIVSGLPK